MSLAYTVVTGKREFPLFLPAWHQPQADISLCLDKNFLVLFGKEVEPHFPLYIYYDWLRDLEIILSRYCT